MLDDFVKNQQNWALKGVWRKHVQKQDIYRMVCIRLNFMVHVIFNI
jgi:hypothetical protein